MGYHSGKWAVIDGESTVRNWALTHTSSPFRYVASNTRGGSARVDGIKDWSGTFDQLGGVPTKMPGDIFAGKFYTAPDNDGYGGVGRTYLGSAIVDTVAINWNWGGGEALSISYAYSGVGPLTEEEAFYDDITVPQEFPICATKIEWGDSAAEEELLNVASATLTFSAENQASVNSSSNCYNNRVAGPIDWTASITLEDNTMPLAIGVTERFLFYIDATDFYDLQWGIVREYSGLTADRETGGIIGSTMNIDMDAVKAGALGSITLPGVGTPWYPPVAVTTLVTTATKNDAPKLTK